jgi:ferredoxin-type protein NapG/ferredoxin-type protein NapH
MPDASSRREFFRGAFGDLAKGFLARTEERVVQRRYLRPPGALPEVAFLAACTRCGDCAAVCPPKAILLEAPSGGLAAGTPYLDVRTEPCIGCPDMPCAAACPTDALTVPPDGWDGYRLGRLELLPERCITFAGRPCGRCVEVCPVGPDALVLDDGGHPVIRIEGCIGCGCCVRACPTTPSSFVLTPAES